MSCTSCQLTLAEYLREDFGSGRVATRRIVGLFLFDPILLISSYRLSHRLYFSRLRPLAWVVKAATSPLTSADIHPAACLGPRLGFAHTIGVVVGAGVRAESDLTLFANVTLGGGAGGSPVLGSRVTVYTGACVAGPIALGDDARVGANTYLSRDLVAGGTARSPQATIEGRVIRRLEE